MKCIIFLYFRCMRMNGLHFTLSYYGTPPEKEKKTKNNESFGSHSHFFPWAH